MPFFAKSFHSVLLIALNKTNCQFYIMHFVTQFYLLLPDTTIITEYHLMPSTATKSHLVTLNYI